MGSESPRGKLTEGDEGSDIGGKLAWVAIGVGLIVGAALVWRSLARSSAPAAPSAQPSAATASAAAAPPKPKRCEDIAPSGGLVIGEATAARPAPNVGPGGAPGDDGVPEEDPLAPFAVEFGQATAYDGGFAAGVLHDAEGGTIAMLATLAKDGQGGK